MPKLKLSSYFIIVMILFTIINPLSSLDILALLVIVFTLSYKILGDYVILAFLALRPAIDHWRDFNIFSSSLFNFNINAGLSIIVLLWSIYFLSFNYEYWKKIPHKLIWGIFILWCAITFIYSYDKSSTITETLKAANLFTLFAVSFVMYKKHGKNFGKNFFYTLLVAAALPFLIALYQLLSKTGLTIDDIPNRIYGTFAHPNILATFALLIFTVLLDIFLKNKTITEKQKKFFGAVGVLSLIIIIFTYTRIAWIGLLALLLMVGIVLYRRPTVAVFVGAVSAYLLFFPINDYIMKNFNYNLQSIHVIGRLTSRNEDSDSIKWRTDVASKIFPLWAERPLVGYGYGAFAKVWNDNKGAQNIWDSTSEAHNDYLKVGFEAGTIGLFLFLGIFALLLKDQIKFGLKNHWKNIVFIASIVVYLILSLSDNMLHHTPVIWWLWALWGLWSAEQTALS